LDAVTEKIASLPVPVARMLAVEILLTDPESLGDDVLEAALYVLREKLRTDRPASPLRVAITVG
jgi:hypothetical protein